MTLSNRLWRAIAARTNDAPPQARLWAKVKQQAHGKRHYLREIALDPSEERAALVIANGATDDYMRFLVAHEREHNPEFAL